jgi:Flp pilus assembly pilin Flp
MPKYLLRLQENWTPNTDYGQDLAEYAVFIGLIALVVVISITLIGSEISDIFIAIATAIQNGV